MKACPRGYYVTKNCGCRRIYEYGYDSKGNCKKNPDSKKCLEGYYYSTYYKKCSSLKRRTCGINNGQPLRRPEIKPKKN